ncbi:MAG: FmdB family zinc ribbon protein [Jatrophihabitantaceae bacterium]
MPTYQYACTSGECGQRFELVQSFTDQNASECPACAGPVRKVFSAVGVVFKGSGFYRNDSRAKNGEQGGSPKSDSAPAASTSDQSSSDAPTTSDSAKPTKPSTSSDSPRSAPDSAPAPTKAGRPPGSAAKSAASA